MRIRRKNFSVNEPLAHPDHHRPRTRRELIAQGFQLGGAAVTTGSAFSLFANPHQAFAELSSDLQGLREQCGISTQGAGKIPFICFDLAGGANIAGSNVLVGKQGGQLDFLDTSGYVKQGLPGDMSPAVVNPATETNDFINQELGLAFHTDSGFLHGILERTSVEARAAINGAVIAARSENDTGNNPHNPMYGINKYGARGSLLDICGSRSSESGGNSMAPSSLINLEKRPTKIDRPSDVTGLVDVGDLIGLLSQQETVSVMETMYRLSDRKLGRVTPGVTSSQPFPENLSFNGLVSNYDERIKQLVRCGYLKSADLADRFGNPADLNPLADPDIVGESGIFTSEEFMSDREFQKTASIMKLVVNGYAGAGTITMGGYDYHTGDRSTGERRDLRAGRCMGACLEYAKRVGVPLMMYVFSDGSVFSNGMTDDSVDGRGKGVWTGDNQQTAGSFFLVYNPAGRPTLNNAMPRSHQIGFMRKSGDVDTSSSPAANNVNLLVETVVLNYIALHGAAEISQYESIFPKKNLGLNLDRYIALNPILTPEQNGVIG